MLLTARPSSGQVNHGCKDHRAPLPSILDIFLARCSSKTNSIVKDPTHPTHSLFQLLPSGRRYRSIRARSAQTAQQLFPPGCESPELRSPRPPLKPHANPYLLKHGPPPPPPPPPPLSKHPPTLPHQRKNCELFLCNSSVLHTDEWACTNHL